ncbi:MAG TPA: hypothetical protein VND65_11285 [Candidatus Binatia bacterium]|nr:hypothetical protein [Candidatus Binatia bacterium]
MPLATRRSIAKRIEKSPEIEAVRLAEGSVLVIQVKAERQELAQDLKRLRRAEEITASDPDFMRRSPAYRDANPCPM